MIMTLPDGRTFRLLPPDEITLGDQILCQKTTGIGPMQLQARLAANMAKWRLLAPTLQALQDAAAADDEEKASSAVFALEAAVAESDVDLMAEGVHIWLSRRAAGERDLKLEEACDFPFLKAGRELEPHEQAEVDRLKAEEERAAVDPTSLGSANGKPPGGPNRQERRAAAKKSTSPST
jgi:hypothetical protein